MGVDFVLNLAKYCSENGKEVKDYPSDSLRLAIKAVEENPKIVRDFNEYGCDWLIWFLNDNPDSLKYWRGVNAFGLQAQIFFYDLSGHYAKIGRKDLANSYYGLMCNKKYDDLEKQIVNEIWKNRIEWQEKGEVLIPMDDSITKIWKDEKVQITNLRQSLLPWPLFLMDIKTGICFHHLHYKTNDPNYDWKNTDFMVEDALKNVSHMKEVHEEVWKMLEDKELYEKYAGEGVMFPSPYAHGECGKKGSEYLSVMVNEGNVNDKASPAILGLVLLEHYPGHENYVELTSLYHWAAGGASYRSEGTLPVIEGDPFSGLGPDGKVAFPVSDQVKEKIEEIGKPIIDPNTQAISTVYCDYDAVKKHQVRFVRMFQPDLTWNYLYEKD